MRVASENVDALIKASFLSQERATKKMGWMGLTGGGRSKGFQGQDYPQGKEAREPRMDETGYKPTGVKSGKQGSEEGNKKTRICRMRIGTVSLKTAPWGGVRSKDTGWNLKMAPLSIR